MCTTSWSNEFLQHFACCGVTLPLHCLTSQSVSPSPPNYDSFACCPMQPSPIPLDCISCFFNTLWDTTIKTSSTHLRSGGFYTMWETSKLCKSCLSKFSGYLFPHSVPLTTIIHSHGSEIQFQNKGLSVRELRQSSSCRGWGSTYTAVLPIRFLTWTTTHLEEEEEHRGWEEPALSSELNAAGKYDVETKA